MPSQPKEVTLALTPQARYDVIDVAKRIITEFGDIISQYRKMLYCSYHTTAGFFEQSFSARLNHSREHVDPFMRAFQKLFPPNADYHHDQLQLRAELSEEQRQCEPKNGDSHLAYIGSGLKNCVTYVNRPGQPVYFIDLDGIYENIARTRQTRALAYNEEQVTHRESFAVHVSKHPIDSINLKDSRLGLIDQLNAWVRDYDIQKGRIDIALDTSERNAGLTVNEYETLLMRHDLAEVLRDPLKFMARQGKHMLLDPRAIPYKTINYAKYDFVHFFNELMDAFRVSESVVERILSTFIRVPAERFLRMKRSISLLVSDSEQPGLGRVVQGTYQSPILVQWREAAKQVRYLDVTLTRFE
ncbi:MAG: hypothetical protein DKINENOH_02690 [bacterium]|nr:hypothetical protein [bacterium]MCK6561777.1 hypothetical protein [bacterium]NUM63711.1 hypothetical protein [candidate division KSB1 bacterium]